MQIKSDSKQDDITEETIYKNNEHDQLQTWEEVMSKQWLNDLRKYVVHQECGVSPANILKKNDN